MKKLLSFLSILASWSITFIFLVLNYDHLCHYKCKSDLRNANDGETSEDTFLIQRKIFRKIYNDTMNNNKIFPEEYPGHDRIPQQMMLIPEENGRNYYYCREL